MSKPKPPTGGPAVDAFMAALDHPDKPAIEALRRIVLAADPCIGEGIKWNAPSFRHTEWFATVHLRAKQGLQVIFHLGAKVKDPDVRIATLKVPDGLLHWLAKDRCLMKFADLQELEARGPALQDFVRQWIALR